MFPTADTEEVSQVTSLNRNSSLTRDAQDSTENSQVAKQNNNRELTLNMLILELVFCIALALTTYGALQNTPTKISKHPRAVRFFNRDSKVSDWYKGQLSSTLTAINNEDVSFVMYYAPWDAESQYVRGEFEKAAEILNDRVHFSAINCWNPGSECRLQHNNIPSWPILMAYTVTTRGVLYKGPRDAHSMVKFLELVMKPLERVSSTEDLVNLLSICDAVAIGYTPLTGTSKYYNVWYHVAIKIKEFDTLGEVCFGVVTSEDLAIDIGVESLPNARFMLWNDTKEYIPDTVHPWNESALIHWVLENFSQPVARIMPMWKKSFSFDRYVDGNPLLMLFTPLNPLYEQLPAYALLREVAMEYYNCNHNNGSHWTSELVKLQQVQRLLYQQKNFLKFCQDYKFKIAPSKPKQYFKKVVSRNNKYPWTNGTQKSQKHGIFDFLFKQSLAISKAIESSNDAHLLSSLGLLEACGAEVLPAKKGFYGRSNYGQCQTSEETVHHEDQMQRKIAGIETTMLPHEDDPFTPENLIQDNVKHFCKLTKFAHALGPPVNPGKSSGNITHINGLACASNFSLHMIALDSVREHHFAESLGIDIIGKKDMTAVVILDSKLESQYVLSEEYSAKSVRDFIYNFTYKRLKRSLRTHVSDASHTHYFGSDGASQQMAANDNSVHIIDLTTKTFKRVVKTPGMVTIVAVCGGACGALVTRSLIEAARLLSNCGVRVQPTRLDALRHDLPWHYTAPHYPTILVFPANGGGEADSRSYPATARVSSSGLVALALRSLGAPQHLRVRLALCARARANIEKKTCLKDMKEHITIIIGRNLKYWRQCEDERFRNAVFIRLQHLNKVSLDLSLLHIKDLKENNPKQSSLLKSLSTLTKHWEIDVSLLKNDTVKTRKSS